MLVVSRKIGEKVHLYCNGEHLATICITRFHRGQVGVGIEADRSIEVLRDEIVYRYHALPKMPAADAGVDGSANQTEGEGDG